MRNLIFLLLMFFTTNSNCQLIKNNFPKEVSINRWMHSIINIEVRPAYTNTKFWLRSALKNRQIDTSTFIKNMDYVFSIAYSGTAIYLKYKSRRYLLTARHVIADDTEGDTTIVMDKIILRENDTVLNKGFNYIPALDPNKNDVTIQIFKDNILLYGLNDTIQGPRPFELTSIANDLGIIDLEVMNKGEFANTLDKRGYKPIEISDIDTSFKLMSNAPIMVLGFPGDESIYGKPKTLNENELLFESNVVTVPCVSTGYFISSTPNTDKFNASVFVYHGFSGGPVISNNKLIGIVSTLNFPPSVIKNNNPPFFHYKLMSTLFVRSSEIKPLLDKLYNKIEGYGKFMNSSH